MTMLARIFQEQLSVSWVVADTVYGSNLDLRNWLQTRQCPYVLAVACDEPVGLLTRDGQRRRMQVRDVESYFLEEQDWQRLSMSQGTKGPRLFDWAVVPLLHQWENDERHWLLIRRFVETPHEKTYYLVFAPKGTTLQEMVNAIGKRWHIEVDFENAKDLGLDHYEVRHWTGWYRHITLCLLAHAFLIGICQADKTSEMPFQASPEAPPLLPLTVPEVRHLLGRLMWPASASMKLVLAWSWWRRWHRSRASYFHTKRRLKAG
jgi:SRSO17 transposase